ncbi:serine/threonine-protein kinase [Pseudonocardia sp. TRM90224]|uniref:serine/threonine-protein kinase n=1 Tax=Pseudonocardia sp. TRM90224 TaxID=2812678 RepID=UPI001E2A8C5B|nr:serine/threonine-protein kinase [Pseudonocardia sp. TRM90224]
MDGLTALLAGLISGLRATLAPDICPGGWPWAVSLLGVFVGLLPTAGMFIVVAVRRRVGSRYRLESSIVLVGAGLVLCGLLPLLVFTSTGNLFRAAAIDVSVSGLSEAAMADLRSSACAVVESQAKYLGEGSVGDAFAPGDPVQLILALILYVLLPVVVTMFVAAQARLVLRRGPSWPSKFFWAPMLAMILLTVSVPGGTAGHLWIGAVFGAFLGIPAVLMAGAPSKEAAQRSLNPPPARRPAPADGRQQARGPVRAAPPAGHPSGQSAARPPDRRPPPPAGPPRTRVAPVPPPMQASGSRPTPGPMNGRPPAPQGPPRFRLIRRLGQGGFGRVWLAHDAKLGHVVALKAAHAPDGETEERIQREARALGAVRHPHCVRIYDMLLARSDAGLAELDGMVIVMGFVDGMSLGEMVRAQGVLDDVASARVWLSVAGALDAAHRQGVMHRDVKPGNVVVDQGGLAHLIDFGIARKTGDATMTMAGFVLGTPDFLAPEAACGERATPASDAWQLAATVSYALTGHPPRGGHKDAVSGLRAAASGAPLSHLPRRTAHLALLQAAMDNDPARRPPLQAVQRALADWLRRAGAPLDGPVTTAGTTPVR